MKKLILSALLVLAASFATAGVRMEMTSRDLPSGKDESNTTIQTQDGKIRVDSVHSGKSTSMIFADNTIWVLDHAKKKVMKIDKEKMEQLGEQVNSAMKQMNEQLAKLPPEQRAMVEKMMKGSMDKAMAQANHKMRLEKKGSGKWDRYTCTMYDMYMDDTRSQEICAASPDQLDGAEEAMQSFVAMAEFSRKLFESFQQNPLLSGLNLNPLQGINEMNGVPVHTIHFDNGKPSSETSLKTFAKQGMDASIFTPPSDYTLEDPFQKK